MTDFTWESWTLEEVARRLSGVDVPWAFAAGWALELYRGAITRELELDGQEYNAVALDKPRRKLVAVAHAGDRGVFRFKVRLPATASVHEGGMAVPYYGAPPRTRNAQRPVSGEKVSAGAP